MKITFDRYRAVIRYVGTEFHGFQVQPGARTVQGELCRLLGDFFGAPVRVTGCSRTDAGVHANAFVIRIDVPGATVPPEKLPQAVSDRLPPDLAIVSATGCSADFHPRYGVLSKEYLYRIYNAPVADPFLAGRAWHLARPIPPEGLSLMREAASAFLGKHDFRSFMCTGSDTPDDTVRTVEAFSVERDKDEYLFRVRADGFLYNMVRIMVGTLTEVAFGKRAPDSIGRILAAEDRTAAGMTAPPEGLYLDRVYYPDAQ